MINKKAKVKRDTKSQKPIVQRNTAPNELAALITTFYQS
jgi:hypothetical protein